MSTKALIGILLAGTAGIVVFLYIHLTSNPHQPIKIGATPAEACDKTKGDCLPEVSYTDIDGKAYSPQSLKGKVVVANFWATWCGPCKSEIPALSKVYDRYKAKGVVFLGLMMDNPSDSDLLNFRSDFEMSYPIVRAGNDVVVSYGNPQALPTTFVFNRSGKQVYTKVGPLNEAALSSLLDQYVAEK
ncbi:MAG TPA: TlpA disulfide reductase family protein [Kofleriaceae bacterium]|nr:TlpA disulfide reductase family protein [Kofleriaceae bacterium]